MKMRWQRRQYIKSARLLWEVKMEVERKYIDADSLMTAMKLSEKFRNRKLEVTILPEEEREKSTKKVADID